MTIYFQEKEHYDMFFQLYIEIARVNKIRYKSWEINIVNYIEKVIDIKGPYLSSRCARVECIDSWDMGRDTRMYTSSEENNEILIDIIFL